jgi:hypothetical protein
MKKCALLLLLLLLPLPVVLSCAGPLPPSVFYDSGFVDMGTCSLPDPVSGPATVLVAYFNTDAGMEVPTPDPDKGRKLQITNGAIDGAPQTQVVILAKTQEGDQCEFSVEAVVNNPPTLLMTSEELHWEISMIDIPGVLR